MKHTLSMALVIEIVLFSAGCGIASAQTNAHTYTPGADGHIRLRVTESQLLFLERAPFRDSMMESARKVAYASKDAEAIAIYGFLTNHQALGVIRTNGIKLLERATPKTLFAFAAVSPEEIALLDMSNHSGRPCKNSLAEYWSSLKTLWIRTDRTYSWFTGGSTILHEGKHAWRHLVLNETNACTVDVDTEEVSVRKFDIRIAHALGGEIYSRALSNETARIRSGVGALGFKIGEVFPMPSPYDIAFDKAFCPALSDTDRCEVMATLVIDATFGLLDTEYGPVRSEAHKVNFIRSIHEPKTQEIVIAK